MTSPLDAKVDAAAAPTTGDTPRGLRGAWRWSVVVLGTAYTGYYLLTAQIGIQSPQAHRGWYVGVATVLILLCYPARKGQRRGDVPWYDLILAVAAAASSAYFVLGYGEMVSRPGQATTADLAAGVVLTALCLEVTRRTVGKTLTVLGAIAIAYVFAGPYLPDAVFHGGYSVERFVATQYTSLNGIFGQVADIFATYVFLFIVFGTFLQKSGAGQFFIDLPYAMAGRFRGGPAKAAILVSALMGSISGSAVANVMTTGTFTIPLMRRVGYSREFSGGVETAASTGGQMLPPVMGAGAFLIAEFTGTPYTRIVLVSIIPALLYFVALFVMVDFEALKRGLSGVARSELESPAAVFRRGWYYLLPLAVVFSLILLRFSPAYAAFWATVAAVAVSLIPYRGNRVPVAETAAALWQGAVASLPVAGVVGTIGIVIGVLNLTGLGLRFSDGVVSASGGILLAALVLVALASWVLGAGLTATSSYVIVAVLAAPALIDLGLDPLVAHLIIFWVSQDANLTPPICVTAFAASSISGGSPMRTATQAWKVGRGLYIVPLLMAYTPLIGGTPAELARVSLTALAGIYVLGAGISRYLVRPATWPESVVLFGAGAAMIAPGWISNGAGLVVFGLVYALQRRGGRVPRPDVDGAIAVTNPEQR